MAKTPGDPKKSLKTPKSKAHRPDVQPMAPALAEILNPAINRGDAGMGSGTGLQPPPDNSKDRRSGGEAAIHRSRTSTPKDFNEGAPRSTPLRSNPQPSGTRLSENRAAFEEARQVNYNTSATIPALDPELAKQLGFTT
ncbi:MAG: excinuclease ABC subunit UvrB, partial [Afipia sp.]|nr:excinuclease ABC subunit UvrB [Afipia sp.]